MSKYNILYKCIVRSVDHIFKNFFKDGDIDEVFDAQSTKDDPSVYVEITGALKGEIMINIPEKTLNTLIKQLINMSGPVKAAPLIASFVQPAGKVKNSCSTVKDIFTVILTWCSRIAGLSENIPITH